MLYGIISQHFHKGIIMNHPKFRLLTAFLLGASMMPIAYSDPLAAPANTQTHTIHVAGQGKVSVRPDKADLTLAVEVHAKTAKAAREQAAVKMASLIAAVKELGIAEKDIQTSYVSLSPEYNEHSKIIGYMLNNQLLVCVRDINQVGTVIDTAVQAGGDATRVQGLSFAVQDPNNALVQARAQAFADARKKAEQYAELAGVSLGKAIQISELGSNAPTPVPYASDLVMMKATAPATPIQAGEQEVSVNVSVMFGVE
jgi:uncharacterized protein